MKTVVVSKNLNIGMTLFRTSNSFWSWFEENRDVQVLQVKFFFFKFDVTVGELEELFAKIFGPNTRG